MLQSDWNWGWSLERQVRSGTVSWEGWKLGFGNGSARVGGGGLVAGDWMGNKA